MAGFRKNGSRIVEVDLSGESVKALAGAMIAYEGDIAFKKAGLGGGEGIRGALKRKVTGESLDLIARGVVSGGMVPKVRSSLEALEQGVQKVLIGEYDAPGALARLLDGRQGTRLWK